MMNEQTIQVLETDVPVEIARLARSLHLQRCTSLSIDRGDLSAHTLPHMPQALWSIDETLVTFSSLEARNQIVATLAFHELVNQAQDVKDSAVFVVADELWRCEAAHTDKACGHFLALMFRRINIFHAAARLIDTGELRVFDVLRTLQLVLPFLADISADDLICVVEAQHEKTKGDMAAGWLFNQIENALATRPTAAWELYHRVKEQPSEAISNLYCTALLAFAKTDQSEIAIEAALMDTQSKNPIIVKVAVWTIGRFLASSAVIEAKRDRCAQALIDNCAHAHADIRQTAVGALAHATVAVPELSDELLKLAASNDQYTLGVIANFLAMNFEVAKCNLRFPEMLHALANLDEETVGGIRNFDEVLSRLVDMPTYGELAYSCLTKWIVNNGSAKLRDSDSIEKFNQTVYELAKNSARLSDVLTKWLLADEPQLGAGCGGLINSLLVTGINTPTFARLLLDQLDAAALKYLARRMLGFIISEEPLLSLTFSLLNTDDASNRTFGLVHTLLCTEIGRDYIRATLDATMAKKETYPEASAMLASVHAQLSQYVNLIEALPRLQELRPPLHLRRSIQLRRSKDMRKSTEAAEEKSVFRQISTQIPLKAGVGWFAVKDGVIGETHRLQSISHSISLPRRSTADPVGYAITGLGYRIAKRGDQ
jgi:hypothetical protein